MPNELLSVFPTLHHGCFQAVVHTTIELLLLGQLAHLAKVKLVYRPRVSIFWLTIAGLDAAPVLCRAVSRSGLHSNLRAF